MGTPVKTVLIAQVPVDVKIDPSFRNITRFISRFPAPSREAPPASIRIEIARRSQRLVEISHQHRKLSIAGPDIDNLSDPFNTIGIAQALFRFVGIYAARRGILLFHASAAFWGKKVFCFGDDGASTAKTLSSVECALTSRHYLADEFCFFDLSSNRAFGYPFVPLHIRPIVKEHLVANHGMRLPPTDFKEDKAGYFQESGKMFRTTPSGKLGALVFVHFGKEKERIRPLYAKEKRVAIARLILAHPLKLFYPQLDRMQFVSTADSTKKIVYDARLVSSFTKKLLLADKIDALARNVPAYKFYISSPCQVQKLLSRLST